MLYLRKNVIFVERIGMDMTGKEKCNLLRQIRKEIAESNGISYLPSDCHFQGDCSGTCPKCDAEIRYLDYEIEKLSRQGKSISLAGLSLNTYESTVMQKGQKCSESIWVLNLSGNTHNNLMRVGITTIDLLCEKSYAELSNIPGMDRDACEEVQKKLSAHGFSLKKENELVMGLIIDDGTFF